LQKRLDAAEEVRLVAIEQIETARQYSMLDQQTVVSAQARFKFCKNQLLTVKIMLHLCLLLMKNAFE